MKFLSLALAAVALVGTANASAGESKVVTYTVNCQTTYVVQNGDTCSKIGKTFKLYTSQIKKWNPSINAGCTNLYINQILCLSKPNTATTDVVVPTAVNGAAAKTTTKVTKTKASKTTVLAMAGPQCQTDDDCAGVYCCNLANNQCVLDPNNNICDIQPPKPTLPSSTTKSGTQTTTSPGSSATCVSGSKGLKKGDGYNGYCCSSSDDCLDTCVSGKCNGPAAPGQTNTKSSTKTTTSAVTKTTTVSAQPTGLTVQISSSKDFCFFLPPSPGNKANNGGKQDVDAIADSEKYAVAFCTKPNINAPGAGLFPSGFITSASYQTNTAKGFVQIRGNINVSAYQLSSNDQGGQYDNHGSGSPPHSTCAGYPYYVNLVEPNSGDFCIRCCQSYQDCNAGRSAYGCDRVVPAL